MRMRHWMISSLLVLVFSLPSTAGAHFCNNIYDSPGRIVVKPERSTIDVQQGQTADLRVFVRNNFPYLLSDLQMQATNTGDFSVTVLPSSYPVVQPGQEVIFTFQITRDAGTGNDLRDLGLQIRMFQNHSGHSSNVKVWRDYTADASSNAWLDDPAIPADDPTDGEVRGLMTGGQAQQMNAATLARLHDELDGMGRLLELFGRPRLNSDSNGGYGGSDWWAPYRNMSGNKYDYQLYRAGGEMAMRRFDGFSDPTLATVRAGMMVAMNDPDPDYRGTAALFAAYLGDDATIRARIELMEGADTCTSDSDACSHYTWTPSDEARSMARAALLLLGDSQHDAAVRTALSSGNAMTQAVAAAALGILGEDDPVTNVLIPLGADDWGYMTLCAPILLRLVVYDRRGPAQNAMVSFYGEVSDDDTPPRAPENLSVRAAN
ncbi:MAG: hypothetical protein JRF33_06905 [Deltaproteobacteria bacterium]|nr:hypothetical protein [Deltaproteobacteria bacterium]